MTGLLLESRAKRQRRAGGASLSVAIHTAIIGAIVAGTANGKPAPKTVERPVHLVSVLSPKPAARETHQQTASSRAIVPQEAILPPTIVMPPATIPVGLPTIDVSRTSSLDDIIIASSTSTGRGGRLGSSLGLTDDDAPNGGEWIGTELLMRIVASQKPRYPESLRQAGIDGHVLIRFTVDTLGAIEMASVQVLESTHDLFTRSVRNVLSSFRFKPAEVGGRRVPSLAEMPFEFSISK